MELIRYEFPGSRPSASRSKRQLSETVPTPPSQYAKKKNSGVELATLVYELLHTFSERSRDGAHSG